jgi:ABC transporter ATM
LNSTKKLPAERPELTPNTQFKPDISTREQRRKDWVIIKRLLVHIWPPNDWGVKGRVLLGLGLLVVGKV